MKTAMINLVKVLRVLEAVMKYVLVGIWAVCLFAGGSISIGAAVFGVIACVITCLIPE